MCAQPRPIPPPELSEMTDAQQRAVLWEEGDLHVTGGPGTGKTAVLLRRVEHLISQNVAPPEQIVCLASTPAAAQHLLRTLETLLPNQGTHVHVDSVALFCAHLLRQHGERIDLDTFSIYNEAEACGVVRSVMDDLGYGPESASAAAVWNEIARTKTRGLSLSDVTDPLYCDASVLEDVYPAYQNVLNRSQALDHWDLVHDARHLFDEDADLLDRYRTTWQHVLVDDLQNWTPSERSLLKCLAGPSTSLFVTSDDDQCVRGPLGAEASGTAVVESERPGVEHIQLTESMRPPGPIRRLASSLLDGEEGGSEAPSDDDAPAVLIEASSAEQEARAIAQRIGWLCGESGFSYGDIAVLPRRAQERDDLHEALSEAGIPVQVPNTTQHPPAVADLLAYLQVAVNPHDDRRLLRIVNEPSRGIGPKTKARLQAYARENDASLWSALHEVDEIDSLTSSPRRSLRNFRDLMATFIEQAQTEPASTWARDLVEESGFLRAVTRGHTKEHLDREEQVEGLLQRLEIEGDLSSFLDRAYVAGLQESSPDHITLSTVRAARGLEFPVVFLPALEEGVFPPANEASRDALLQNERRTFYAGLTRAQERLFLSWAGSRSDDRTDKPTTRSRFLDALDAGLLRTEEVSRRALRGASDEIPSEYQHLDPHYYRDNLRAQQRDPEARPTPTADAADRIREGLRVEHQKMGIGTVLRTAGEGEERIAVVDFDDRGEKKVKLQYAPLTVIDDSAA